MKRFLEILPSIGGKSFVLLGICTLSFSFLFGSPSVNAASVYDDLIVTTDSLTITSPDGTQSLDITESYLEYIVNPTTALGCDPTRMDAITDSTASYVKQVNLAHGTLGSRVFGVYGQLGDGEIAVFNDDFWFNRTSSSIQPQVKVEWYINNSGDITASCTNYSNVSNFLSIGLESFPSVGLNYMFYSSFPVIYPLDYEGEIIPDSATPTEPEIIYPQYNWTVSKDENDNGILTVKYQDNLPHFLTGISSLEVIRFTEHWEEIDESLGLLPANPAGWADWQFNIGQGEDYYMFRVTHNQQLDVPPWGEDDNYYIGDVLYQFYWDGQTFLNGTTVGCDGIVCNEFEFPDGERAENQILAGLKVETFGLSSLITAPLNFFSQLPNKLDNCTPITFPFHFGDVTVPCLTPVYRDNLGALFTLYQTVLVGLFTYFLGLRIFGNIKDISNPKDSSIEVVKL